MKDKLFLYIKPLNVHQQHHQLIIGRAVGTFLHKETITYYDSLFGEQYMLGKLMGLVGEGRVKHLFIFQAEVLSIHPPTADQFIKMFRDYGVEIYFGVDIIPKGDERFEHIINPKFY